MPRVKAANLGRQVSGVAMAQRAWVLTSFPRAKSSPVPQRVLPPPDPGPCDRGMRHKLHVPIECRPWTECALKASVTASILRCRSIHRDVSDQHGLHVHCGATCGVTDLLPRRKAAPSLSSALFTVRSESLWALYDRGMRLSRLMSPWPVRCSRPRCQGRGKVS